MTDRNDDFGQLDAVLDHMAAMYPQPEGVTYPEGTQDTIGFDEHEHGPAFRNRESLVLERLDTGGWRAQYSSNGTVSSIGTPYFYGPTVGSVLAQLAAWEY